MKRLIRLFAGLIVPALLLMLCSAWWQGEHGGRRYLLWTGRFSLFAGADPGRLRILLHYDGREDALPVRSLYATQWRTYPSLTYSLFGATTVVSENVDSIRGFEDADTAIPVAGWPISVAGFRATTGSMKMLSLDNHLVMDVPYWMPFSLLTALLLLQGWFAVERLQRFFQPAGLCRGCGYDLRASPGRCPECGSEPSPGEPVPREILAGIFAKIDLHFRHHALPHTILVFLATLFVLQWLTMR